MNVISTFRGKYAFLSNFSGDKSINVEIKYQAAKAIYFEDYLKIINCSSAKEAKELSKTITVRKDWNDVRVILMEQFLREKYSTQPYKNDLLATGNAMLIEGNHWCDTFWGVCNGLGENKLGVLLMKIRDEFLLSDGLIQY